VTFTAYRQRSDSDISIQIAENRI